MDAKAGPAFGNPLCHYRIGLPMLRMGLRLVLEAEMEAVGTRQAGPLLLQSAPVCAAASRYPPQRACVSFCLRLQTRLLLELTLVVVWPARVCDPGLRQA